MVINILILLGSALIGGLLALLYSEKKTLNYSLVLVFSGAYLFSITIIHILPELFISSTNISATGLYILGGFFLQQILESLTAGAEHGHIHHKNDSHHHSGALVISLLVGLTIHSVLEGSILTHSHNNPADSNLGAVALGIGLHKMPAAFAMMTILLCYYKGKAKPILYLILFSLASPIGLILSQYALDAKVFTTHTINILFALVGGSFLYISTTIVFESAPSHHVKASKIVVLLLGAIVAVLAEMMM